MKYIAENAIRRLIKYDGPCCLSCHREQDELGYHMSYRELGKERATEICCNVVTAFDKWRRIKC